MSELWLMVLVHVMGLATGLCVWWMERQRRVMWQEHARWLAGRCEYWSEESNKWLGHYVDATKALADAMSGGDDA